MKKTTLKVWNGNLPSALPATREELLSWGLTEGQIDAGEAHGELTVGMYQIPATYRALCMSATWDESHHHRTSATVYGMRTLAALYQSGHCLEGRVSLGGSKVRGFTSSQLFELPDGKLVDVAVIRACIS